MPVGVSLFSEEDNDAKANKNTSLNFAAAFYGKNFLEMDIVKEGKTDEAFEEKERKGDMFTASV